MQTFLPYPNFADSARVLDDKRLGKQRVECLQILQTLQKGKYKDTCRCGCKGYKQQMITNGKRWCDKCGKEFPITPWYNHPAVRMWRGFNSALALYACHVCYEWRNRGFKDTVLEKICHDRLWTQKLAEDLCKIKYNAEYPNYYYPPWLGDSNFHASHRSNLLRKFPEHYQQFNWTEPNNLLYVWPV